MDHTDASLLALREELAALCHEQWSGWMSHLFKQCDGPNANVIPSRLVSRWYGQIATPYERLSEAEKDSDRKEADRFLALMADALRRSEEALREKDETIDKLLNCQSLMCPYEKRMEDAEKELRELRARAALPDTTAEAAHGRSPHVEIIVNGQPVQVAAGPIRDAIADAIRQSGQIGAPIDQWVLRTRDGEVIPHELPDGREYALVGGQRFFLHLGLPKADPADSHPHQASSRRPAAGLNDVSSAGSPDNLAMVQRAEAAEAEVLRSGGPSPPRRKMDRLFSRMGAASTFSAPSARASGGRSRIGCRFDFLPRQRRNNHGF